MYEFLSSNPILAVAFIILVLAVMVYVAIKVMQKIGMSKVRSIAYDGFVAAEEQFNSGEGKQKLEYVVNLARSSIPAPFNIFITTNTVTKVVQLWFDLCKNLLDSGRKE